MTSYLEVFLARLNVLIAALSVSFYNQYLYQICKIASLIFDNNDAQLESRIGLPITPADYRIFRHNFPS